MKKLAAILCLATMAIGAFAQGTVNFGNSAAYLISHNPNNTGAVVIPATAGQFYFGLFTAAPGTTDRALFTFTGNYATNLASAGRLLGGTTAVVNNWAAGVSRATLVYGWSADLGHDWNPAWLTGSFPGAGINSVFGWSTSASPVIAGGFDGTGTLPTPVIFSSTGIASGFVMNPVPEPTTMALAGLGAAALLIFRRRK